MEYELLTNANEHDLWRTPPLKIMLSNYEHETDIILAIARASISHAPRRSGAGYLDERALEPAITDSDMVNLHQQAQASLTFSIDYWKGQPVKLHIKREDFRTLTINTSYWMDRWDLSAYKKTPQWAMDALGEVLEEVNNSCCEKECPK